jgi:hypothetical protein
MDEAAQLRIEQAAARKTRTHHRPFIPHVCADCAHPTRLDRDAFDRIRAEAAEQQRSRA